MKPKIGISLGKKPENSDNEYREAVVKSGGEPILLRPGANEDFSAMAGLVLTGGEDVDPAFYGEKKELYCDEPDRERDEFEFALLKKFFRENKPVLAICRGIQVLNVALGGSLYQDILAQLPESSLPHQGKENATREEKRNIRHPIQIKQGSVLEKLCGGVPVVNTRHHQAIKKVAPGLSVTAKTPDGLVEGVESNEKSWVVGVQWHPESKEIADQFLPLFQELIRQCERGGGDSPPRIP